MDGFHDSSYGDAFADVYDEWYAGISDVASDGRRARPASRPTASGCSSWASAPAGWRSRSPPRGLDVTGVDSSAAMLDRARRQGPSAGRARCAATWSTTCRPGPFDAGVRRRTTRSSTCSPSATRQRACFAAVAARLAPGGVFVVEAFVPEPQRPAGGTVGRALDDGGRRSCSASTAHDAEEQTRRGPVHRAQPRPAACACDRGRSATRRRPSSTRWQRPPGSRSPIAGRTSPPAPFDDRQPAPRQRLPRRCTSRVAPRSAGRDIVLG